MAICWHFYHVKLQGKTFRPERGQLQVICSVMDMDANLKVQGSWKNSDLYHTVLNTAKACEELPPDSYTFAWGKICQNFFIHSEALKICEEVAEKNWKPC